jgi:HAD superfamily hydrolase (TIGR01509 family)
VRGYHPREDVLRDFAQRLPWRTIPEVSRLRRHWETCFPRSVVARAGLDETLSALHAQGMRLGVVTNGEVAFQAPKITQLAIGRYLSTVVISEAVQVQKPDPRIFAQALAELGCQAANTWFVGDDPVNDVRGAAAVGLRAIWLPSGRPWPRDCCTHGHCHAGAQRAYTRNLTPTCRRRLTASTPLPLPDAAHVQREAAPNRRRAYCRGNKNTACQLHLELSTIFS